MRPDRIILGELRSLEAKDFLLALSTGHKGCMATIHANSAKQALIRLEMLVQLSTNWSINSIKKLLKLSLNYIVVVRKIENKRKLYEISEITGLEESGLLLHNHYKLNA